jgi:hypothetical protein
MDWFSRVLSSFTKPYHFWLHEVDLFFLAKYVLLFFLWQLEHRVGPGREAECQWELKDCIAVQKLLETTLDDGDAASSKLNISLMYNSWIPNYIMRYGRWSGCHQCTRVIFTSFAMT